MVLWKRLLFAILLTCVHLLLLNAASFLQGIPALFWPSLTLRIIALALAAPALGLRGFIDLHLGGVVPLWVLLIFLHLATPWLYARCKEFWSVLHSSEVPARRALFLGAGVLALGSTQVLEKATDLQINPQHLKVKNLPPQLSGLRIALLADLHRGPAVSQAYLEDVVRVVNRLNPDLVLMPGDFVSKSDHYFESLSHVLSQLRPKIASLATLGNHDHWEGEKKTIAALESAGVIMLQNRSLVLSPQRRLGGPASSGLCLAGVDDLWAGRPDLALALGAVPQDLPVLLLSHNPDLAETQANCGYRVDLQLSGHTHGGQVVLPGIGPLATASSFGTKYLSGWAEGPKWPVFTTVGVGTSTVPLRIGTRPEVVLLTLT